MPTLRVGQIQSTDLVASISLCAISCHVLGVAVLAAAFLVFQVHSNQFNALCCNRTYPTNITPASSKYQQQAETLRRGAVLLGSLNISFAL
jgi:hypothetical protein